MRYIRKRGEPHAFKDWKRQAAGEPDGLKYPIRSALARKAVVKQLRSEQGNLCAYTMWRLDDNIVASIEHIHCRQHHPDRALDYNNMVLCAKGTSGREFAFGESQKGNLIVTDANFVSPLSRTCEGRFEFHFDGSIRVAKSRDVAAEATIKTLKLDDPTLNAARARAIREAGVGPSQLRGASIAKARKLAASIANAKSGEPLPPFAIAIKQSALLFVRTHERLSRRLAARQSR